MEYCPPYSPEDPNSWYFTVLHITFCISLVVNFYVFYCIIFLSNKQMKTYRWYLLWHQLLVFSSDLMMNFLGQPVIFFPFRMGYPTGILKDVIPSVHFVCLLMLTLFFELSSDAHLFLYRLVTIKGYDYFPWFYKIWTGIPYLLALIVVIIQMFIVPNQEETIFKYSQKYSCINESLLDIPNFIIYDEEKLKRNEIYQWTCMASVVLTMPICLFLSLKATTTKTMSARLVKLQRQFLYQLIVLIFVPLGVIIVPMAGFTIILSMKIYALRDLGQLVIVVCSMVSTIGGLALIIMNPTYHPAFIRQLKEKTKISVVATPTPSIGIIKQQ